VDAIVVYFDLLLEALRKTTKNFSADCRYPARIRSGHLPYDIKSDITIPSCSYEKNGLFQELFSR
jgi:hypothetical protein